MMNKEDIKKMIQRHEGFVLRVYLDSVQVPTGGYGHAFLVDSPISQEVAELLFDEDFARCELDYEKLGLKLDSVRRAVIIDMLFNLGLPRLRGFKKMFSAIKIGNFERTAEEMLDSKWARQVGYRAKKLSDMMRTGE